jgi:hypothetical protein
LYKATLVWVGCIPTPTGFLFLEYLPSSSLGT